MSDEHRTPPPGAGLPPVNSRQEFAQWRMRLIGPVVIVVLAVTDLGNSLSAGRPHRAAIVAAVVVYLVGGVLALGTRSRPVLAQLTGRPRRGVGPRVLGLVHAAALIALAAASAVLTLLQAGLTGTFGLFFAVVASLPLLRPLASAGLAAVAAVLAGVGQGLHHTSALGAAVSGLAFAGAYVIVLLTRRIRQGNDEAELMHRQAAALAERQRLAREMHDVLAHSLSGLMLQLEGARLLATQNPQDPRLPEIIERAHHLGKTGLEEARRAIGMLRDDDLPGPEQLATLAGQFERDSGIACRLTVTGEARELDSEARLALYRVAQEALTNIRKHARSDRVDIRLAYADGRTSLTVEDFSPAAAVPPSAGPDAGDGRAGTAGGYGLTGMRERAELLGGSLRAGPTGRGFRVELQVPA